MSNILGFDRLSKDYRTYTSIGFYSDEYGKVTNAFIHQLSGMEGGYQRPGNGWVLWF